jgi:putative hydrolase of the HAD superfamily
MSYPKVIFFDAVGTLFGVSGSVGQHYRDVARDWGVDANARQLNDAFFEAFRTAPPMAFPGADPQQVPELEFRWWELVAERSFERVGVLDRFQDFPGFFRDLWDYFAGPAPWFVYPEVLPLLDQWSAQGRTLAVLSNFDSRLYPVLEALSLRDYFASVTISTEVGAAKPEPQVFAAALAKHDCAPHEAWHIGDSYREDCKGATAAGLRAIWVNRP